MKIHDAINLGESYLQINVKIYGFFHLSITFILSNLNVSLCIKIFFIKKMNLITIQYAQMQNQKYAILFRSFHSAAASNIALKSLKSFNTPDGKLTYGCKDALQCMHTKHFSIKILKVHCNLEARFIQITLHNALKDVFQAWIVQLLIKISGCKDEYFSNLTFD